MTDYNSKVFSPAELSRAGFLMYNEITDQNEKAIKNLMTEFNSRKKAFRAKNATVNITGVLNPNKLYNYKLDDKIFLSRKKLGDAKSHGFVILLDWSGSMRSKMTNGLDYKMLVQSIVFAEFCSKLSIPYAVYTYTTCRYGRYGSESPETLPKVGARVDTSDLDLIKILGNSMSSSELTNAKNAIGDILISRTEFGDFDEKFSRKGNSALFKARFKQMFGSSYPSYNPSSEFYKSNPLFNQSSTPTMEAFLVLESELGPFKKLNGVEKISIIHITDGSCSGMGIQEYNIQKSQETGSDYWDETTLPEGSLESVYSDKNFELQLSTGKRVAIKGLVKRGEGYNDSEPAPKNHLVPENKTGMGIFLNAIKKEHNATITGYYLAGSETDINNFLSGAISKQSPLNSHNSYLSKNHRVTVRENMKKIKEQFKVKGEDCYIVPNWKGHDSMILIKGSNSGVNEESISENFEKNCKKATAASLKSVAADTIGQEKKSRFLAQKVMEIAA